MKYAFHTSLFVTLLAGCSCTTSWGTKSQSAKSQAQFTSNQAARVQGAWQTRFEFAVTEAGSDAEGWALFADSPMGHTGQQLVVRFPNGMTKLCYAPQSENDCKYQELDSAKFQKLMTAAKIGDGLTDRPLQTFDTLNLEYLHIKNTDGKIKTSSRVFFMVDHKPLPNDYNQLMDSFTGLNK